MLIMLIMYHVYSTRREENALSCGSYQNSTGKVFSGCTLDRPIELMKTSARQNIKKKAKHQEGACMH